MEYCLLLHLLFSDYLAFADSDGKSENFYFTSQRKKDGKLRLPKMMIEHSVLPGKQSFGHPDFFSTMPHVPK